MEGYHIDEELCQRYDTVVAKGKECKIGFRSSRTKGKIDVRVRMELR